MATDSHPLRPATPRRIKRLQIGLNVFVQALIVFALVVMVNYVGFRQFKRWDFSRNKKYALSSMTTNLLASLDKPVKAIVFFNANIPVIGDVGPLLKEYEYASKKKFQVEVVDPYNNVVRAKELASKYKFGGSDNIVILDYNGRTKFVEAPAMADYEQLDQMAAMTGQQPRLKAFKGEQAITSALLEIIEEKQHKLYMVSGHGEPALKSESVATFKAQVERQNVKMESLKLSEVDRVPEDASALVIFGARADLSDREVQLIKAYWAKNGRLFVLLDPEGRTPRLDFFLLENGITPAHDRVLRTGTGLGMDAQQKMALSTMVIDSKITGVISPKGQEISKDLAGIDTTLLGLTESFQIDQSRAQKDNLRIAPLIESNKDFWGETEYAGDKAVPFFDPKKDHMGPLAIAAAAEKGALADRRVKMETSRLIVVGNAGWLTEEGLRLSEVGIDFALNSVNWLLNREEQLAGIPPKVKQPIHLDLNEDKLSRLAVAVIMIIPAIFGAIGVGAWLTRRS